VSVPKAPAMPGLKLPAYYDELSVLPGFVDGGFTSSSQTSVFVYWHGSLSSRAKSILARARAADQPITVRFVARSTAELDEQEGRLNVALEDAHISVWIMAPHADGSAIDISGPDISTADYPLVQKVARAAGVSITVDIVAWDPKLGEVVQY
jgi:hypothetical protein